MTSRSETQIALSVSPKVHENLTRLAKRAGVSTRCYAKLLLAAYSARCGVIDDAELIEAVERLVGPVDAAKTGVQK